MKKAISILLLLLFSLLLAGCGTTRVTDPAQYGKLSGEPFPDYFPKSIDAYTVNSYSCISYQYFDNCTEVFLDISVTEEQLQELLKNARGYSFGVTEQQAYYDTAYHEIIFCAIDGSPFDSYSIDESGADDQTGKWNVGNAQIRKMIFNPETHNVVFEYFNAFDTGVYPLDEVAYFNRFGIDQSEYANHTPEQLDEEETAKSGFAKAA